MNRSLFSPAGSFLRGCAVIAMVAGLAGCLEDEREVRELRQLREKLAMTERKLAEVMEEPAATEAAVPAPAEVPVPAPVPAPVRVDAPGMNAQELKDAVSKLETAEVRISQLEKELQKAQQVAKVAEERAANRDENLQRLAEAMENDLLTRVGDLRKVLGETIPAATLLDTTVKRLRPVQTATTYDSEIRFKVKDSAGQVRLLVFPVQPGEDGQWHLPEVATVQKQIIAFVNNAQAQARAQAGHSPVHGGAHAPSPLPLPPGVQRMLPQNNARPAAQAVPDTFVIRWEGLPPPSAATPAPTMTPAPAAAPSVPRVPAPSVSPTSTRVPPPVMPVREDVQVRFE